MAKRRKSLTDRVETQIMVQETGPEENQGPLEKRVEKTRVRQKSYVMDLRIHSPASLGYLGIEGLDTAPALVRLAKVKGLDVIAVTDFYSGQFIDRVAGAARTCRSPLTVLPGVVIRCAVESCDDVPLLCLFPEAYTSSQIDAFLDRLQVPADVRGQQHFIVRIGLPEILTAVDDFQGLAVPSRMDKTPSRLSVIASLVEKHGFRAFDLAYSDSVKFFKSRWPRIKFHLFSFSNANTLAQVGSRMSRVRMPMPGFEGLKHLAGRERHPAHGEAQK